MTILRFGTFEFDRSLPELRKSGRPVHLQDMPLRVLGILLEHPGELIAREVFFERLWPDDESGILDDNLNTAIRKLRLALNDSAHHPEFIETVPKRGYRFVARLETDAERTTRAGKPARPGRIVLVAGLALLLFGLLVVGWQLTGFAQREGLPVQDGFRTLAVLPFVNASDDAENRYFSDGLTEELMDQLSRIDGLRVVSRTSSFSVDTGRLDAREIGRVLNTDVLVEGSVRRDDERLRVSVRLINARDGYQLWSERYDRRMHDLFSVQQEIAGAIARTLSLNLETQPDGMPQGMPVADSEAYDHYLKGRYHWHRRTEAGLRLAARHFRAAVTRAPGYARAWAGLGDAYAVLGFYDYLPPAEAFPQAREAALRALSLEPDNAEAEATLGYAALYFDWNLPKAEEHFRRAIALSPGFSKAYQWYGNLLTAAGRFDEAEQAMRRATQLDPLSLIASAALGWTRYFAGRNDAALAQLGLTAELDADFELVYLWAGWTHEAVGDLDAALAMLEEAVTRSGGSAISVASLVRIHALRGELDAANRLMAELLDRGGYLPAYEIAKAWLALGRKDEAMQWLERAFEQRSHSLVFLEVDPQLIELRDDPDFLALAARVRP